MWKLCYNLQIMAEKDNRIIIFSDGASKGNPGPGGYGAVVVLPEGKVIELGEGEGYTTNNRMELAGAIAGLTEAKGEEEIVFYTDSKYVINGMTGWKSSNCRVTPKRKNCRLPNAIWFRVNWKNTDSRAPT